jgi:hypothetical protein
LLGAVEAQAYPQYIALGEAKCSGCHISPTGGGMPSSMGLSTIEAIFPDLVRVEWLKSLRAKAAKSELTGRDENGAADFQLNVGVDTRSLFLQAQTDLSGFNQWVYIPMLLEAGTAMALGPWQFYGTLTPRRRTTADYRYTAFSREHWVGFALNDTHLLRAGRMVLPFGLRHPDHTLYTREDFRFNKWDQSYALSWDVDTDGWELHVAGFVGDLFVPTALQERGGAVSSTWTLLEDRLSLGVSALLGRSSNVWRPALSGFFRVRPLGRTYVVGELSGQWPRYDVVAPTVQWESAAFLRVGWFIHESTDLYVELAGRLRQAAPELTKRRLQVGINTHVLPWVELAPSLLLEDAGGTGLQTSFLGQLHVFY